MSVSFEEMRRRLQQQAEKTVEAVADANEEVALELVDVARERVPVVSGELQDSIGTRRDGARTDLEATAEHAATVHEDPESTGYKFLEQTVTDASSDYAERVAAKAKRRVD